MKIDETLVNKVINITNGYVVGGYVRDKLLGVEPKDCDIVTPLSSSELYAQLKKNNIKYKEIGAHFQVVQIKIENHTIEIARMREDVGMPEDRKEQNVSFTKDIYKDLSRRDFTINAIAWDGKNTYVTPDTMADLKDKIVRFVGVPSQRIQEDPLRILRALRFTITKGMNLEVTTREAILKEREEVNRVSIERIRDEIEKMLVVDPCKSIEILEDVGLLEIVLPEIYRLKSVMQNNSWHEDKSVYEHTLEVLNNLDHNGDLITIYAALLHDTGKADINIQTTVDGIDHFYGHEVASVDIAHDMCIRWKLPLDMTEDIQKLIKYHDSRYNGIKVKKLMIKLGSLPLFYKLIKIMIADSKKKSINEDMITINKMLEEVENFKSEEFVFTAKDLAVNGHDLMKAGYKGMEIGTIQKKLMSLIEDGIAENTKIDLEKYF